MQLKLDNESVANIKNIIKQCETHFDKPLSYGLFEGNKITAYLRTNTKLYEGANEVEYSKYVGKVACDVKAVLEIRQINFTDGEDNLPRLHINVYDALIRKHVHMAPTEF